MIRPITSADLPALIEVINSSELFPGEPLVEMTNDFLTNSNSSEMWYTYELNGIPSAIMFCAPEKLTEGTYNLYLIAVCKNEQGSGIGTQMMNFMEKALQSKQVRILLVETSSLPEFELTRKFYDNLGFTREAVIREFYQKGEDKIVFWKKIN